MDAPGAGAKALRIEVPQTAEARRQRTFTGEIFELAEPQDWSVYNRLALWVFVEPSKTPRGASLSVHLYNDDGIRRTTGIFVVPRGKWQRIVWDVTPMPRCSVSRFMITQSEEMNTVASAMSRFRMMVTIRSRSSISL